MKVIFLDIDGVLNSDDYIDRAKNVQGIERHIDIDKVKLLKKAIDETGAKNSFNLLMEKFKRYWDTKGAISKI